MLLFTDNIPQGVFCEWSVAEVTENPRVAAQNGVFCRFYASRSMLLFVAQLLFSWDVKQ